MPEIEITVDQREYLEDLQAELEEDVVYGHVRLTDALQFLIDSREGELSAAQKAAGSEPADDEEYGGADSAAADEADAEVESNDEEGRENDAEAEDVDDAVDSGIDDAEGDETDDGGEPDAESDEDAGETDADDTDEDDAEPAAAPTPGGGDRLNAMMQLLDTHDEKWREGSGDARYEVDLPDGSTETANTKDDVRALLFKNY